MPVVVFCLFLPFQKNHYQTESKQRKNFVLIFSGPEGTLEALGEDQTSPEEAASSGGAPRGVGAPSQACGPLMAPIDLILAL